jgi:hypothetical protein
VLLLVRQVQVFEPGFVLGAGNCVEQFRRHRFLFGDRGDNLAPVFN